MDITSKPSFIFTFGCTRSLLLCTGFLGQAKAALLLPCAGFSLWWFLLLLRLGSVLVACKALGCVGPSGCGTWGLVLRGMWNLPGPGIKVISPTLAGKFLSTEPPGKS